MDATSIADQPTTNGIHTPPQRSERAADQWAGSLLPSTLRRLKGLELVGGFDLPKLIDAAIDAEIKRRVQINTSDSSTPQTGAGRRARAAS